MKLLAAAWAACALAAVAQKRPVTLDDAAATRDSGPASVEWSPGGKSFAWSEGGKLRIYDAGSRKERIAAALQPLEDSVEKPQDRLPFAWQNRGVREKPLQWSRDGSHMLVALAGDLFWIDLASGREKRLTKTPEIEHDPKLSPDSRRVSFRRHHDLYVLEIDSLRLTRLTRDGAETRLNAELDWVYPEELALPTAHWWSPDSRRIAYLQFDVSAVPLYPHADLLGLRPLYEPQRYPQAGTVNSTVRLGVVSASGGKTKWLETGAAKDDLLARAEWVPGGESLAVQILPRIQNRLSLRRLTPGRAPVTLLEEKDGAWVNLKDGLRWLDGGRFLWISERSGFAHLYLIENGTARAITSGDWEVTEVNCVDPARGLVYYTSTEASPAERHLYRVKLDGTAKERLTKGRGTYAASFAPGCAHWLARHSSLVSPPRQTLMREAEELAAFRGPATDEIEKLDLLPVELSTFRADDGAKFHARLIKPAGFDPSKKYPAVVMVYGGPHAQRVRDMWRGADWDQALAHKGFVIWEIDNRGTAARGHAWEARLHRRFGRQELEDQLEGLRHLTSMGFVDPFRVGLYGWSYGGFMTLTALLNAPDTFRAGIAGAPVTDWRNYDTIYTERYLGLPQENEQGYRESSPLFAAARLKASLMLALNYQDDNVLFQHTLRMMDALQKEGKPFELLLYPQKTHGVTGAYRKHMLEAMTAFLERSLK
jgi:dipeptidyl-peptidase-4